MQVEDQYIDWFIVDNVYSFHIFNQYARLCFIFWCNYYIGLVEKVWIEEDTVLC